MVNTLTDRQSAKQNCVGHTKSHDHRNVMHRLSCMHLHRVSTSRSFNKYIRFMIIITMETDCALVCFYITRTITPCNKFHEVQQTL